MGKVTTIVQAVDCTYGDDHKISIALDEGRLISITCSCYTNRREVKGLTTLGGQKNSTCLQGMEWYLKTHVLKGQGSSMSQWNQPANPYRDAPIGQMGNTIRAAVQTVRGRRARHKQDMDALEEKEMLVPRKMREYIAGEVGRLNHLFAVRYDKNENTYSFFIIAGSDSTWNPHTQSYEEKKDRKMRVATRKNGVWHTVPDWEKTVEKIGVANNCPWCDMYSSERHLNTAGHKSKVRKYVAMAMQATSQEGMAIVRANQKLRGTEHYRRDYLFKYRKGTTKMKGVVSN